MSNTAEREEDNFVFYLSEEIRLISFYKNYRIYRIPFYNRWDSIHLVNDSLIESRTYKVDTNYYYFARKDTANIVYRFTSLVQPDFIRQSVDSLYKISSDYREPSVDEHKINQYTHKIITYTKGDLVTDVYAAPLNRPENSVDTFLLTYSTNKFWDSVSYTFSYSAEAEKSMKLVKFKLISRGNPGSPYLAWRKPLTIGSEIMEMHPANDTELKNAFLEFEKFINK